MIAALRPPALSLRLVLLPVRRVPGQRSRDCGLHHNPDFIITALYNGLSQGLPGTRCLASGSPLLLHLSCPKDGAVWVTVTSLTAISNGSTLLQPLWEQLSWAEAVAF